MKMFKNIPAKYYQKNKERLQKKACERCRKLFLKGKKKKSNNKNFSENKKSLLSLETNTIE